MCLVVFPVIDSSGAPALAVDATGHEVTVPRLGKAVSTNLVAVARPVDRKRQIQRARRFDSRIRVEGQQVSLQVDHFNAPEDHFFVGKRYSYCSGAMANNLLGGSIGFMPIIRNIYLGFSPAPGRILQAILAGLILVMIWGLRPDYSELSHFLHSLTDLVEGLCVLNIIIGVYVVMLGISSEVFSRKVIFSDTNYDEGELQGCRHATRGLRA